MAVHLSEHFTYKKLFKAVFPSICMMIFTSIYSVVDGLFVSNSVGKTAFAALNLIFPALMVLGSIGFMMGAGGSALVAKTLGEGDNERANKIFSMVIYFTTIVGALTSMLGFIFTPQLAKLLGATPEMLPDCVMYGRILMAVNFIFMLQNLFQNMFIVAEKPILGFIVTVVAGFTNIILDALFVGAFKWGLAGAAVATSISYLVGGALPLVYFLNKKNSSLLRLVRTGFDFKVIGQSMLNGSSELLTNVSASIVSMLFNMQLLKIAGENGVAAYGVIMYLSFVFVAIFIGYAIGVAPITGYNYGAENHEELKNVLKKSLILTVITGVVMTILTQLLSSPLSKIFVGYDADLLALTTNGMRIYGISFLVCGINIFASSFFTSLNNGIISGVISFARTLLFQVICILILPALVGVNGIWLSVPIAECMAMIVSIVCLATKKKKYNY